MTKITILVQVLLIWCSMASIFSFTACFIDKRRAIRGEWRISEKLLLLSALAGGAAGLLFGMKQFRHKTKKWYFRLIGWGSLVLWTALLLYLTIK